MNSKFLTRMMAQACFLLHRTLPGHRRVQAVAFTEWLLSEVMPRTPALSYAVKESGLEDRSFPLSFSSFFPGRELRPWLCRDSRHEQGLGRSAGTEETECQRTRRVQEQLALQRTKKGGEEG